MGMKATEGKYNTQVLMNGTVHILFTYRVAKFTFFSKFHKIFINLYSLIDQGHFDPYLLKEYYIYYYILFINSVALFYDLLNS